MIVLGLIFVGAIVYGGIETYLTGKEYEEEIRELKKKNRELSKLNEQLFIENCRLSKGA